MTSIARDVTLETNKLLHNQYILGGEIYNVIPISEEGRGPIDCNDMIKLAKLGVHNGKERRLHLLRHENDIPDKLRGKVIFVFVDEHNPGNSGYVTFVSWYGGCWYTRFGWFGDGPWLSFPGRGAKPRR